MTSARRPAPAPFRSATATALVAALALGACAAERGHGPRTPDRAAADTPSPQAQANDGTAPVILPEPAAASPAADPPFEPGSEPTDADPPPPAPPSPPPLRIDAPDEVNARVGQALAFAVGASDGTGEVPALALVEAPAGAELADRGDGTRELRWTPLEAGEALVSFEAYRTARDDARTLASTLVRVADGGTVAAREDRAELPIAPIGPESRFGQGATLRSMAAAHGVRIGTASIHDDEADLFTIPESATWIGIVSEEYDVLTPENEMKMSEVQPARGAFEWEDADRFVAFAEASGQAVHGHSLVWHDQVPSWARRLGRAEHRDEARAVMREHIGALVSRYRGRVEVWDVVNEALEDGGQLRHGTWHNGVGPDYIGEAFRIAREFDPDAALIYNDYHISWSNPKSEALLALLRDELAAGTPIDGVGFQMHLNTRFEDFDAITAQFARFAELGLDLYITELDVATDWRRDPEEQARRQADVYANALRVCLEQVACKAFQTWGLSDRYAWRGTVEGLPFDDQMAPKPAFRALQSTLRDTPIAVGR